MPLSCFSTCSYGPKFLVFPQPAPHLTDPQPHTSRDRADLLLASGFLSTHP